MPPTHRSLAERIEARLQPIVRVRPEFIIIGAQKAGTTSLHRYLSQHPMLAPSNGPKEIHFFNLYYDRGLAWYLKHFPVWPRKKGKMYFEATPDYLHGPVVPERIRSELGRVKLIAVLREPAARAFSAWRMWHTIADRKPGLATKADPRSFERAIDDELRAPDGRADGHFHYVAMGRYFEHLTRYRDMFAAEDLLVLHYQDMNDDLLRFLNRICEFLSIGTFEPDVVRGLGGQRHWESPVWPETEEVRATLDRLRDYYRPHNEQLFAMLGERWDW